MLKQGLATTHNFPINFWVSAKALLMYRLFYYVSLTFCYGEGDTAWKVCMLESVPTAWINFFLVNPPWGEWYWCFLESHNVARVHWNAEKMIIYICKIHSWCLRRLRFWDRKGAILLGDLDQRQWLRSLKSWCIKQGNESSTRVDSSIPLIDKNLSDLGSLILILITPKECVLNFTNSEITPLTLVRVFVCTRNFRWF